MSSFSPIKGSSTDEFPTGESIKEEGGHGHAASAFFLLPIWKRIWYRGEDQLLPRGHHISQSLRSSSQLRSTSFWTSWIIHSLPGLNMWANRPCIFKYSSTGSLFLGL